MKFDWRGFLDSRRIHYRTQGPNTPTGDVSIRCPFCGDADHSEHMVISMSGQGWHCWRVHNHKGGHPAKLVSALLRCSISEAYKLTNVGGGYVPTSALDRITAALTRAQPTIN